MRYPSRRHGAVWQELVAPSVSPAGSVTLNGVTATSPSSAWAVGRFATATGSDTLILHWNGKSWTHVASANLASENELEAVDASSASDVWAVGDFSSSPQTLALHCC